MSNANVFSCNADLFLSTRFQQAWYNFVSLLDIDIRDAFECPVCLSTPDTVVMDGVGVAPQKRFIPWGSLGGFCKQGGLVGR